MEVFTTAGVDLGFRSVKVVLLAHRAGETRCVASESILVEGRRDVRDALAAVREAWVRTLGTSSLTSSDVALAASTGSGDHVCLRVGHHYKHLSQTLGARYLYPDAEAVLDVGTSEMRCVVVGSDNRIRRHRETLWSAQETMAAQAIATLRAARAKGPVVLTGGTVLDSSFVSTLMSRITDSCLPVQLLVRPEALYAGAYGAALLAAWRYRRLSARLCAPQTAASQFPFEVKRSLLN